MASFPASVKNFGADRVDGEYIPADDVNLIRAEVVALETELLLGGWRSAPGAWSFATSTTITVPAGAASIYSVGDKIKWWQGSQKYAYIVGVANTLLTVRGDAVVAGAITLNYYSKHSSPVGFPHWFAWVPDLTLGLATLPGYAYARYSIVGRTCTIVLNVDNVTIGGAAGSIKVSLPVPAAITSTFWGNVARYLAADGYVPVRGVLSAASVEVFKSISTTTYLGNETGFYLRVAGSYEI
ncbi:MAG TPA: hypothetical protein VGK00_10340 [Anaerolineales bacterium]|jgi:hypothetical protein